MIFAGRFSKSRCGLVSICLVLMVIGCGTKPAEVKKVARPVITFDPPPERSAPAPYTLRPQDSLSFSKDIAPIVFQKCSSCHHPGEIGPFPLLSYADVKKRAKQIVDVIQKRIMPPWSPLPDYCSFERDRSLTADEIGMITQWVDEGGHEGDASELPPVPEFTQGWKHGKPDMVVSMAEPFLVSAESTADVYRKFVIRVPIEETRYIRAFDFDPGSHGVVHHMRLRTDRTSLSRAQDQIDSTPGFDGTMFSGDVEPDGFFLVWTPGYEELPKRADVAWKLEKGTDLVLELHLHPTGKAESVQSSIALYFQPKPPRDQLYVLQLDCPTIDIAAGKKGEQYEDRFVLPVDATLLATMPHAHFLATQFRAWAVLPDGQKTWLMRIEDWDFNWQREYTYAQPISLPKGTTLCMQVTYDNSADNPRNPHSPPQRVFVGRDTYEEMAQIFFQLLSVNPKEGETLFNAFRMKEFEGSLQRERFRVSQGRGTTETYFNLGCLYGMAGDLPQALSSYQDSVRLNPGNIFAINNLGSIYRRMSRPDEAIKQYLQALELNPRDARVHLNLGLIYLERGRLNEGTEQLEESLRINPELGDAWATLGMLALRRQDFTQAESHFERAIKADPGLNDARITLQRLKTQRAPSRQ